MNQPMWPWEQDIYWSPNPLIWAIAAGPSGRIVQVVPCLLSPWQSDPSKLALPCAFLYSNQPSLCNVCKTCHVLSHLTGQFPQPQYLLPTSGRGKPLSLRPSSNEVSLWNLNQSAGSKIIAPFFAFPEHFILGIDKRVGSRFRPGRFFFFFFF